MLQSCTKVQKSEVGWKVHLNNHESRSCVGANSRPQWKKFVVKVFLSHTCGGSLTFAAWVLGPGRSWSCSRTAIGTKFGVCILQGAEQSGLGLKSLGPCWKISGKIPQGGTIEPRSLTVLTLAFPKMCLLIFVAPIYEKLRRHKFTPNFKSQRRDRSITWKITTPEHAWQRKSDPFPCRRNRFVVTFFSLPHMWRVFDICYLGPGTWKETWNWAFDDFPMQMQVSNLVCTPFERGAKWNGLGATSLGSWWKKMCHLEAIQFNFSFIYIEPIHKPEKRCFLNYFMLLFYRGSGEKQIIWGIRVEEWHAAYGPASRLNGDLLLRGFAPMWYVP